MIKRDSFYSKYGAAIFAVVSLVIMYFSLFHGGAIGLSDNGDFVRVMNAQNLVRIWEDRAFTFIKDYAVVLEGQTKLEMAKDLLFSVEGLRFFPSIQQAFVRVAVVVCFAFKYLTGQGAVFSLCWLGAMYCILYAALIALLFYSFRLKNLLADIIAKSAILIVLCDTGYTAYFNSLYAEPVQMLALVAMASGLIRLIKSEKKTGWFIFYCVCALIFGWSKFNNIPSAALFIVCALIPVIVCTAGKRRIAAVAAAAAALAIFAGVLAIIPFWMSTETDYNAVFYGALKDIPEEDIPVYAEELGVGKYASLAGTHNYVNRVSEIRHSEEFEREFSTGKVKIALFYLRHPSFFLEKLAISIHSAGYVKPFYLANEDSSSLRLTFSGRFAPWSWLRERAPFDTVWLNAAIAVYAAVLIFFLLRRRENGVLWAVLLIIAVFGSLAYDLVHPIITNGEADLAKHMFSFVQLIDALLIFDIAASLALVCENRSRVFSTVSLVLVFIIAASPAFELTISRLNLEQSHDELEQGAVVALGEYYGMPLRWIVYEADGETATLMCLTAPVDSKFDADGSNLWSASTLRAWLNGGFIDDAFTDSEKSFLIASNNRFVLSEINESLAADGNSDFYAFHTVNEASRGEGSAVGAYCEDTVFLPDLSTVCTLRAAGFILPETWCETPYFSNGEMVRILAANGDISMRDADDAYHVAPCITVSLSEADISGQGSFSHPFELR